jgi:hypothetical protein
MKPNLNLEKWTLRLSAIKTRFPLTVGTIIDPSFSMTFWPKDYKYLSQIFESIFNTILRIIQQNLLEHFWP